MVCKRVSIAASSLTCVVPRHDTDCFTSGQRPRHCSRVVERTGGIVWSVIQSEDVRRRILIKNIHSSISSGWGSSWNILQVNAFHEKRMYDACRACFSFRKSCYANSGLAEHCVCVCHIGSRFWGHNIKAGIADDSCDSCIPVVKSSRSFPVTLSCPFLTILILEALILQFQKKMTTCWQNLTSQATICGLTLQG